MTWPARWPISLGRAMPTSAWRPAGETQWAWTISHAAQIGSGWHATLPILAHASGLRLGDIDPAQIISLGAETGIAQMIASSAAIPDRLRTGQLVAHSTIAQLLMVAQNLGVALLPEYAAGVLGNQQIVFRHIDDLDLARSHYLLRRSAMSLSPAASALFAMLQGGQS